MGGFRVRNISNTDATRHDVSQGSTFQGYDLQDDGQTTRDGPKKNLLIGMP
jgi:hypothetical protein